MTTAPPNYRAVDLTDPTVAARHAKQAAKGLRYIAPIFKPAPPRRKVEPSTSITNTTNWSGGVLEYPSTYYVFVEGGFTVPSFSYNTNASNPNYMMVWVGMGGAIDPPPNISLIQSGIYVTLLDTLGTYSLGLDLFVEWFPAYPALVTDFPVNQGDDLGVTVECASGYGATEALVTATNYTQSVFTCVDVTAPSGTTFTGSSAEWIAEADNHSSTEANMPVFSGVTFTGCYATQYEGTAEEPTGAVAYEIVINDTTYATASIMPEGLNQIIVTQSSD
jgi:hypothetical protein